MMKKVEGASTSVESSSNQKMMLKHQSLLHDFDELQKETEAMRERLERMKKKKLILVAEVGFLRRRYKYLMKNPSPFVNSRIGTYLRQQIPFSVLDSKERLPFLSNGKEPGQRLPIPVSVLNEKGRTHIVKEVHVRNTARAVDLNGAERFNGEIETPARNVTPAFDLNQVSMEEEEEVEENYKPLTADEIRKSSVRGASDEQLKDMKLSICRNTRDGSRRTGKRKISWQDQVALRV